MCLAYFSLALVAFYINVEHVIEEIHLVEVEQCWPIQIITLPLAILYASQFASVAGPQSVYAPLHVVDLYIRVDFSQFVA